MKVSELSSLEELINYQKYILFKILTNMNVEFPRVAKNTWAKLIQTIKILLSAANFVLDTVRCAILTIYTPDENC